MLLRCQLDEPEGKGGERGREEGERGKEGRKGERGRERGKEEGREGRGEGREEGERGERRRMIEVEVYLSLFSVMEHELQWTRKLEDPHTIETAVSVT